MYGQGDRVIYAPPGRAEQADDAIPEKVGTILMFYHVQHELDRNGASYSDDNPRRARRRVETFVQIKDMPVRGKHAKLFLVDRQDIAKHKPKFSAAYTASRNPNMYFHIDVISYKACLVPHFDPEEHGLMCVIPVWSAK
jgi:hypothetical protein